MRRAKPAFAYCHLHTSGLGIFHYHFLLFNRGIGQRLCIDTLIHRCLFVTVVRDFVPLQSEPIRYPMHPVGGAARLLNDVLSILDLGHRLQCRNHRHGSRPMRTHDRWRRKSQAHGPVSTGEAFVPARGVLHLHGQFCVPWCDHSKFARFSELHLDRVRLTQLQVLQHRDSRCVQRQCCSQFAGVLWWRRAIQRETLAISNVEVRTFFPYGIAWGRLFAMLAIQGVERLAGQGVLSLCVLQAYQW